MNWRALEWTWKGIAWSLLVWGLFAAEKVKFADDGAADPARAVLDLAEPGIRQLQYVPGATASVECAVSVRVNAEDDREIARTSEWEERGATVSWSMTVADDHGKPSFTWNVSRDQVRPLRGGTSERMLVGKTMMDVQAERTYDVTFEVVGEDGYFRDRRPQLTIGGLADRQLTTTARRMIAGRNVWPGLVLLSGLSGVFVHVFFFLARLALPWRTDAPEPLPDDI